MILPQDIELPDGKFRDYLLVSQESGDKSEFLGLAGYEQVHWEQLRDDLRDIAIGKEAIFQKGNINGEYYQLDVDLAGPNGKKLPLTTIWLQDNVTGRIRFITLFPKRRI
jgi:hypothetical protein